MGFTRRRSAGGRIAAGLAAYLMMGAAPSYAGSYTYTSITPANAIQPSIGGMNDSDQVVGVFQDPVTYVTHGFLWSQGSFTQIDLSPYGTTLTAINDTGIATGFYYPTAQAAQNFQPVGVTYNTRTGAVTPIPVKKNVTAYPTAINATGGIIGVAQDGYYQKALIDKTGKARAYSAPNAPYETVGVAINDENETLIDAVDTSNNLLAFKKVRGKLTPLAPPGGVSVNGWGCGNTTAFITNTGVIGGDYGDQNGNVDGFTLSKGGKYTTYIYPGANQTTLSGMSPSGVIAGCSITGFSFGVPTLGFVYLAHTYYPIQVPGSVNTYVTAINAANSLAGNYNNQSMQGVFIAQCPAGQAPCTR
jgi:hypothetical protein